MVIVIAFMSTCSIRHAARMNEYFADPPAHMNFVANTEKPVCSNDIFRSYYLSNHNFPPPGKWTVRDPNVSAVHPLLSPDICSFSQDIGKAFLQSCFQRKRVRYILMMGDSQGVRYSWGVWSILNKTMRSCELLKRENITQKKVADPRYFSRGDSSLESAMVLSLRYCEECVSYTVLCKAEGTAPLTLEFIGFHHMSNGVMEVDVGNMYSEGTKVSFQEFVIRHYLKDRIPDIIVIPPPVNHAKFNELPPEFKEDLLSLKALIDLWMPETTQVYWLPGMAEHENRRTGASLKWLNASLHGKLASDLILDLNNAVYKGLESDLVRDDGRHFGFLDLFKASRNRSEWSHEGVHMEPFWYEVIMSYFLQVCCAS